MTGYEIHCGDGFKFLESLSDASVDSVVTDPPYGTKKTGWDESITEEQIHQCIRVARHYAVFFYSNTRLWHILGAIKSAGRDAWTMVWSKKNAMGFERRFAPRWTPVVVAYKGNPPFWGPDLFECAVVPHKDIDHPTIKPVGITQWLVEQSCPEGGTVLDPCMGSGTTGVACAMAKRHFIGVELRAEYFEIAKKRIEEAMDKSNQEIHGESRC